MIINWNNNDTKYIIKKLIIYLLIAFAMFIIGIFEAKADSVCLNNQTQWLQNDYVWTNAQGGTLNLDYFYGRGLANCSEYVKIQIPINWALASSENTLNNDSNIYRLDMSNGDSYYGTLNNGYLEFIVRATFGEIYVYPKHLYIRLAQYTTFNIIISRFIQAYNIGTSEITNNINNVNNSVNNVNNSINNDNITNSDADDFTNNQAFSDSTGLESVIQLPLNMVNSLTSTCEPIQITIPFIDYTGELPCMSTIYQSKFNTLYTIVKIVINGFFVYRLLLKVYELVHDAKQPDEDKLEVIDL